MSRVNYDKNIDPDWGNIVPPVDVFYNVSVNTEEGLPIYGFVLMMPLITDFENDADYISLAISQLVDMDAAVIVKQMTADEMSSVSENRYTTMACFKPDNPEEFVWLMPPKFLMH